MIYDKHVHNVYLTLSKRTIKNEMYKRPCKLV